jgi:hypothetical protein
VADDQPASIASGPDWAGATTSSGLVSTIAFVDCTPPSQPRIEVETSHHRTALGENVGLPWLELDCGDEGEVALAWLVQLGNRWDPAVLSDPRVTWLADGARVEVDGRAHHCGWTREEAWRADNANQGIFRVGSAPLQP